METTRLWQIIRKMPKGALLHAHMDAMVDFDFLFEVLLKTPGMHMYCASALSTPEALEVKPFKFRFFKSESSMTYLFSICTLLKEQQKVTPRYGAQVIPQILPYSSPKPPMLFQTVAEQDFLPGSRTDVQSQTWSQ